MKLKQRLNNTIVVETTTEELGFLHGSVLEALEALPEWEFQTRTGETRARALEMMKQIATIIHSKDSSEDDE